MRRKRLFIHIGYPKCGSTSLQAALIKAEGILYPISGRHAGEHLSLPLYLKGIDAWTANWFSEKWVAEQHAAMMKEITSAHGNVFLSSERLVALKFDEIVALRDLFPSWGIEIIIVTRALDKYLDSTWRHAVFRHDYAESNEDFLKKMAGFSFFDGAAAFERYFPVHILNMDDPDYPADFTAITDVNIALSRENVGVPKDLAILLQKTHKLMGSKHFKAAFPPPVKEAMRAAMTGETVPLIDTFAVPLF